MNRSFGLPVILFGAVIAVMQSQIAAALTPAQISEKAQQITVRIDGPDEPSSGSGVIIGRRGNTYYVITNAHVVDKKGNYTIYTPDGKRYPINYSQVKLPIQLVDLAVLQFTSNQNYQVAEKGNSDQTKNATNVYVAGFPLPGPTVKQRIYRFLSGSISGRLPTPESGYELVYEVAALSGMSGGPILNEQGQVVGINGRGIPDARTGAASVVGIPINTYVFSEEVIPNLIQTFEIAQARNIILRGIAVDEGAILAATLPKGFKLYETGNDELAIKDWQNVIAINNKNADALLALAVALYTKGNRQQGLDLAKQAFQIDARYSDINFLKQKGWGKRLLADTANFIAYYNTR